MLFIIFYKTSYNYIIYPVNFYYNIEYFNYMLLIYDTQLMYAIYNFL